MPSLKKTSKSNPRAEGEDSLRTSSSSAENNSSRRSSCSATATPPPFDEAHSTPQNETGEVDENSRKNGELIENTVNEAISEHYVDEDVRKTPGKERAKKDEGMNGSETDENSKRGGDATNARASARTSASVGEIRDKVAQEMDVIVIDDDDDVEEETNQVENSRDSGALEPSAKDEVLRTATSAMQQTTRKGGSSNLEKTSNESLEETLNDSTQRRTFTAIESNVIPDKSKIDQGIDLQVKSNNHANENTDKSNSTDINARISPNTTTTASTSERISHDVANSQPLRQNPNAHCSSSVSSTTKTALQTPTNASLGNFDRNSTGANNGNINIHSTMPSTDSRSHSVNGHGSHPNIVDQLTSDKSRHWSFNQGRLRGSDQAPKPFQSSVTLGKKQQFVPQQRGQECNQPNVAANPSALYADVNFTHPQRPSQTACTVPKPLLPVIERWSEYRIDEADSIEDLESIRHRLMSLLERVDRRLTNKRVNKAILTLGVGGVLYFDDNENGGENSGNNVDGYHDDDVCLEELRERLRNEMMQTKQITNKTTQETLVGDGNKPNGKRQRSGENEENEETENKRHRCFCCALCFETGSTSSFSTRRSTAVCNICDEKDLCDKCITSCEKCNRSVCADCLLGCDNCGSRYYCSDCMTSGNGQCVFCVTKEKVLNDAPKSKKTARSKEGSCMNFRGRIHHPAPPNSLNFSSILQLYNQELPPHPNAVQNHHDGPTKVSAILNGYSRTHADPQMTSNEMFSTHRFIISKDSRGKLGFTVKLDAVSSKTFISDVIKGSVADIHGIQAGDVICRPFGGGENMTYYLFVEASKSGTLIFDIKRPLPSRELSGPNFQPLSGPCSLHRFYITEAGKLGITVALDKFNEMTFVHDVVPGSIADIHGIAIKDVICKPYTNGREKLGIYDWFMGNARNVRPLVFEVWRREPHAIDRRKPSTTEDASRDNPFNYMQVMFRARGNTFS